MILRPLLDISCKSLSQNLLLCIILIEPQEEWLWFDLILYEPVNKFSVMSVWVFLGLTSIKLKLMCLAQGHNTVKRVRLNPSPHSQDTHSTTEALHTHKNGQHCHADNSKYMSQYIRCWYLWHRLI